MYICYDCHETFERCASETEPHGEVLSCCPVCGSTEVEEAVYCKICGEPMCEDELTEGICDDCIAAALDYDTFRSFALDGAAETDCSLIEEFVYCWLFGLGYTDAPNGSHEELRKLLVGYYDQRVAEERSLIRDSQKIARAKEERFVRRVLRIQLQHLVK